ncbi:esterase [Pontibacillus halophilus JSM 076056 = DSM 19796]|uniref:Esterase n=2 Tax=Pontibacillus TaxID=289201 RepID=A0A0A5GHC6_9BACI|nr:alpha/beta fold hydrolase [Pontibacillus halophilus]KGX92671.1 esterase [Pontibacillus halophilus JSM 076056 = DSM 19796]
MIGIYKETLQHIPALIVVDAEKYNEALPVHTYFHGYTSCKENQLHLAYRLAEKGYRVVLPDSRYHGDRTENLSQQEVQVRFWQIVKENVSDLAIIKEELERRDLLLDGRIGVGGTSMGGITTAAALTQYDWIKASTILMGSPKLVRLAEEMVEGIRTQGIEIPLTDEQLQKEVDSLRPYDLSLNMDRLQERPIFFWHGDKDPVVPYDHSYQFYNDAIPSYRNPESIRFLTEVGRDHKVSTFAITETAKWLEMHL